MISLDSPIKRFIEIELENIVNAARPHKKDSTKKWKIEIVDDNIIHFIELDTKDNTSNMVSIDIDKFVCISATDNNSMKLCKAANFLLEYIMYNMLAN